MKIKAISLWQPWADAMRVGAKTIETRSWPTNHRGLLAIHAAKKPIDAAIRDSCGDDAQGFKDFAEHWVGDLSKLDLGAIICGVKLIDCRRTEYLREEIPEDEELWGNYGDCRWEWVTDPQALIALPVPVPVRGHQGLFDREVWPAIEDLIRLAAATTLSLYGE